jgi:hypothetical protein
MHHILPYNANKYIFNQSFSSLSELPTKTIDMIRQFSKVTSSAGESH